MRRACCLRLCCAGCAALVLVSLAVGLVVAHRDELRRSAEQAIEAHRKDAIIAATAHVKLDLDGFDMITTDMELEELGRKLEPHGIATASVHGWYKKLGVQILFDKLTSGGEAPTMVTVHSPYRGTLCGIHIGDTVEAARAAAASKHAALSGDSFAWGKNGLGGPAFDVKWQLGENGRIVEIQMSDHRFLYDPR